MQKGAEKITEKGATLWAISYDSADTVKKVQAALKVSIPLLADEGSKIIDSYGVRNPKGKGKKAGVAIPMTLIIGKDGNVKSKLAHDSVRDRHGPTEILAELEKL